MLGAAADRWRERRRRGGRSSLRGGGILAVMDEMEWLEGGQRAGSSGVETGGKVESLVDKVEPLSLPADVLNWSLAELAYPTEGSCVAARFAAVR